VQIIPFEAELTEQLPALNDLLDLFIAFLIDISDLDRSLLDKIDLIVVIGLEIDVFSFGHFDHPMFYTEVLIFFIGQMAPEVIIAYQ
jgi:hypothetical protein